MSKVTVQGNVNGTGTFTIAAPNSNTDRTLTLPDNTGTVLTDASTVIKQAGTPAFSAYRSGTAQSVSSNTYVKVQLNSEDFDTSNCFDNSTNYRFTPTVAGYYQINGSIVPESSTSFGNGLYVAIYKNGTSYRTSGIQNTVAPTASIVSVGAVIYLNGTTDYVELYGYSIGGVGMSFTTSYSSTAMSGCLLRGA